MRALCAAIMLAVLCSACCGLDENKKSRDAMLKTAVILEAEADYIDTNLDPVALAIAPDGSFDQAACIEHSKMREIFRQDNRGLAAALRAWAEGAEVEDYEATEVDHAANCPVPSPPPEPDPEPEPTPETP